MNFLGLLLGATIVALVLVVWFKWHKRMTGGGDSPREEKAQAESLEAFIAAYRSGNASARASAGSAVDAPSPAVPSATRNIAAAPAGAPAVAPMPLAEAAVKRDAFLTGAAKLVYLTFRSGLRDHHCFAQVRLQSLCTGRLDPGLQSACVDLLVCNASMSIVAAIDIVAAEQAAVDAAKTECLRGLGIRYLRLSPRSLPKPGEIRTLLYRM